MKPRVGVSQCLLGEEVRYDGKHKLHSGVVDLLGPRVQWVPVCPEVDMGLGVPRKPLILKGDTDNRRLVEEGSGRDLTDQMVEYSRKKVLELKGLGLDGFVLKKSSPSCDPGWGLFARVLEKELPNLPIAHEEELESAEQVEAFLKQMSHR